MFLRKTPSVPSPTGGVPSSNKMESLSETGKTKILVLGEAGVGKTTFVQSVQGRAVGNPKWTVGCSLDVLAHSYKAGSPDESTYLVELWDVGGSRSHRNSRHVFYAQANGLILVHDLSNRKTEDSLNGWLNEVLLKSGDQQQQQMDSVNVVPNQLSATSKLLPSTVYDIDKNTLIKDYRHSPANQDRQSRQNQMPILIVGSKADLSPPQQTNRKRAMTELNGWEEMNLDCRQSISPGSTNGLKISRFFDRVIDWQVENCGQGAAEGRKSGGISSIVNTNVTAARDRRREIW